jgi:hypothetical protein
VTRFLNLLECCLFTFLIVVLRIEAAFVASPETLLNPSSKEMALCMTSCAFFAFLKSVLNCLAPCRQTS